MAIRPADLQLSYMNTAQNPPVAQRAEEGPRTAQAAAQAAFVADTTKRNETIGESTNAQGNKINVNDRDADRQQQEQRERKPGDPFEEVVEEAAGLGEPQHLIDFTA